MPNIPVIKKKHVCGLFFCNFCGEQHYEDKSLHLCPILRPQQIDLSLSSNLGFLSFEIVRQSNLFCKKCFQREMNCGSCYTGKESVVNICTVFEESKFKGSFDKYCFSEFESCTFKEADFTYKYNEGVMKCSTKKTFFNQTQKRTILKSKFQDILCPLGQFFNHILQHDLKNFTYIVYDNFFSILDEILKFLLKHGMKPKVVCIPDLALIDVFELQVRFINLKNYVGEDSIKYIFQESFKEQFFPLAWNQPCKYEYVGAPPTLKDFYFFDDSEDDICRKKVFVEQQKQPWSFIIALKSYSDFKARLTSNLGLSFLKQSIKTQNLLKRLLHESKTQNTFVHPFHPPIFTRATYAYQTLLTFCPDLSDLRILKDPVKMASSKSELEYCAFLRFLHPKETFQDAWSPFGQKTFRQTYPDSFSPTLKTAYYFNGCAIHGHKQSECLFKRKVETKKNYFNVPFHEALMNFEKKKENLLKHQKDVEHIEVQWECLWKLRRKTDPILQNFIANVFQDPPNYRLNVRASGN